MTQRVHAAAKAEWEELGGNSILQFEDFYLSHNPAPILGTEETAIVKDERFYILNGDWRDSFVQAAHKRGFDGCIALFLANQDKRSSWSNDYEEVSQ